MAGRDLFAEVAPVLPAAPIKSASTGRDILAAPAVKEPKKTPTQIFNDIKSGQSTNFDLMKMVENIPTSAKQYAGDLIEPFMSPIQTAKSIGNLALGGLDFGAKSLVDAMPSDAVGSINKFNNWLVDAGVPLERLPENKEDMTYENIQYANQLGEFIDSRYGSMDAFKKTAMSDPVGVLGDVAGVMSGGALLAPKMGSKMGKIGSMIDPANLAVSGAAKVITNAPLIKKLPEALYSSAAKFGGKVDSKKVIETALANQIMPTSKGMEKAERIVDYYDDRVSNIIDDLTSSGEKVPRRVVFNKLKELRKELGGVSIDSTDDLKKINKVARKYELGLKKQGKDFLTASDLQKLKRSVYKSINYKKSQQKGSMAKQKAYKAIAQSAREQIEAMYPGIKNLNAKEGAMLELMDAIEVSASRIERRDLIGIGTPLKAMAGSAAGGPAGAAAGIAAGIADMPRIKAKIALALRQAQQKGLVSPKRTATLESLMTANEFQDDQK